VRVPQHPAPSRSSHPPPTDEYRRSFQKDADELKAQLKKEQEVNRTLGLRALCVSEPALAPVS